MNIETRIAAALAQPLTHRVLTTYADGRTRHHDTRSLASAQTHAPCETRKVGRDLIDPDTGLTVRVVSVSVGTIEQGEVAAEYVRTVGYDPFADDPSITIETVRQTLAEHAVARESGL